jgi:hypothetical protein
MRCRHPEKQVVVVWEHVNSLYSNTLLLLLLLLLSGG